MQCEDDACIAVALAARELLEAEVGRALELLEQGGLKHGCKCWRRTLRRTIRRGRVDEQRLQSVARSPAGGSAGGMAALTGNERCWATQARPCLTVCRTGAPTIWSTICASAPEPAGRRAVRCGRGVAETRQNIGGCPRVREGWHALWYHVVPCRACPCCAITGRPPAPRLARPPAAPPRRRVLCVPCGHMVLCANCAPLAQAKGVCPLCMQPLEDVVQLLA